MFVNPNGHYDMSSKEAVLELIEKQQVKFVGLWFTDITGVVKSIMIPVQELERVIDNGAHFDGSAIEGFARAVESDMVLKPDLSTFTIIPWTKDEERTACLICTLHTPSGEPFIGDPRTALIRVLKQAEEMGFTYKTGMELEFFLFQKGEDGSLIYDQAGYFDLPDDPMRAIRRRMMITLSEMNIGVDSMHSESGAGQHEIDFSYKDALVSADNILKARVALKTLSRHHGMHCTFMPRPAADMPGSGMHTHQSLHHAQSGENAFVDDRHEYGLSETARHFLAGQLAHACSMSAVLSPLVNSYKRLGTSFEAPVYVTWAHVNRGALIRVPSNAPGQESHTRLELRCPDPSANPYLATAVMLQAGLDGIRHRMPLPEPVEETLVTRNKGRLRHIETLPSSLESALEALSHDDVILAALGPYIGDRFLAAKRQEVDEYNRQVTQWERDQYLNRF